MKKHYRYFTLLLLCLSFITHAQTPNRVSIKGIVIDSSGTALAFPTVMLLNPKDSALVNFSRASEQGIFEFKGVKNTPYLLKISYTGYLPHQESIGPFTTEAVDVGKVKIKPIVKELLEVVIKTARAPLTIRGDTIEYDARTFKVPPGSTVEDLLRRLPGIDVDASGNIKAQGQDVNKVLVDGKTFFGEDPKAATKNLGAETISKVQVFNDKSEQAKLTGIDDGKKEKAINLELKDEFKKGRFGKITGAVGTSDRAAGRGNFNRFNKKEQLSFIGYANNINETGVNWDDYGEFKGNNSWNFDSDDFGFSSGNRIIYITADDNGDVPRNSFDGRGFTQNGGLGVNYNYTQNKTKLSTSYFYNQTRLNLDQFTNKQTFQQTGSFFNTDTTNKTDFRATHRMGLRWEEGLDSTNTLITKANIRFSNSNVTTLQGQRYLTSSQFLQNNLSLNNTNKFNSYGVNSSVVWSHKFKQKKGRNFSMSLGFNASGLDGTEGIYSLNRFFSATSFTDQVRSQRNENANSSYQLKSSAFLLEPISKKIFWESFYNFSYSNREVSRGAFNRLNGEIRFDSLSNFYTNSILYNRLGTSLRYSNQGLNISFGLAGQKFDLEGKASVDNASPIRQNINRNFFTFTPNFNTSWQLKNNTYLNVGYNYGVQEPSLNDLQPVVNNTNPFFITEGNPNLLPQRNHNINFNGYKFDPATFFNLNIGMNYNVYNNQIIYTQTIDQNFVTRTRPENISGGKSFNTYFYTGFPIIKTKLNLNVNGNINFSESPTFINAIRNETNNKTLSINTGFSFTPGKNKLILDVSGGITNTRVTYSIATQQNQTILTKRLSANLKWNFAPKFFLESNYTYTGYENDRFNFNQNIPIWNASVRRLLTKDNKLEVRLAAFDMLNRRVSVRQNATVNYVSQEIAPTLARYFMISFSYNLKGYQDKLSKGGFF
ncbi:MAG: TonB-dependent receptor [Spirosomataceae bacterium]